MKVKKESGTGSGLPSYGLTGPILSPKIIAKNSEDDESAIAEEKDEEMKLQAENLKKMIQGEVRKALKEAAGDTGPTEDWSKFALDVDNFINESIKKAQELQADGEKMIHEQDASSFVFESEKREYLMDRLSFLKRLIAQMSQNFESLRREIK